MAKSPVAPKMTTVNLLELVSFIDAGLDLVSGRKPPLAVLTESHEPALARGLAVSSMDMDFDGRVAGLRCCDVLLLSVFSAKAAIVLQRLRLAGREARAQLLLLAETSYATEFFTSSMAWLVCNPAVVR